MPCLSWHSRLKHNEIQCKNKYRPSLGHFCQYWVRGRSSNQYKFKYSKNASGCFNPKFIPSVISSIAASWPYHLSIIEMLRLLTLCEFILMEAKDMNMYLHISPVFPVFPVYKLFTGWISWRLYFLISPIHSICEILHKHIEPLLHFLCKWTHFIVCLNTQLPCSYSSSLPSALNNNSLFRKTSFEMKNS